MPAVFKRLLGVMIVLGLVVWLVLHAPSKPREASSSPGEIPVYIVANGWHAGIVLPAQALHTQLPLLRQRFPGAEYYEIGWGDVGFYRAKTVTTGLALQAMFASKGSVMHVVAVPDLRRFLTGSDVSPLCVDQHAYERMAQWIADSFERTPSNQPVDAGPGIYGDSQFYIAKGEYSMLNTCNRWTASVLSSAGLDLSPRLSLTADSVLRAARNSAQACPAPDL